VGQIAGTKNAERPGSIQNVADAPFATQVGQDRAGSLYAPRPKGTTDAYIAMVYEQQGNYEKANEEWGAISFRAARTAEEKAHAESDTENMRESLRVSGRRGYWESSLRIIQRNSKRPVEALSANETRASSAYALATAYAALGEKDEAFV
jgi:hypothetical protein